MSDYIFSHNEDAPSDPERGCFSSHLDSPVPRCHEAAPLHHAMAEISFFHQTSAIHSVFLTMYFKTSITFTAKYVVHDLNNPGTVAFLESLEQKSVQWDEKG